MKRLFAILTVVAVGIGGLFFARASEAFVAQDDLSILGHRGFHGHFPENTMIGFERAYLAGADGIELDVQLTSDGEVVLFHDMDLDEITNGQGRMDKYPLVELQKLKMDLDNAKGLEAQRIPTLREYLKWASGLEGWQTNIELKVDTNEDLGLEKAVYDLIQEFECQDQVFISSFYFEPLVRMRALDPDIKIGFLVWEYTDEEVKDMVNSGIPEEQIVFSEKTLKMMKDHKIYNVNPSTDMVDKEFMALAEKYNMGVYVYTVNDILDMMRLMQLGVDGIITDFPDRLVNLARGA